MANTTFPGGITYGKDLFHVVSASMTVSPSLFGRLIKSSAADVVVTLPLAATHKGAVVTVVNGVLSTGTGLSLSPNAADNIYGNGLTAVDDKDLINTGATDVVGDSATVVSDGTNWLITNVTGTWAKEG